MIKARAEGWPEKRPGARRENGVMAIPDEGEACRHTDRDGLATIPH